MAWESKTGQFGGEEIGAIEKMSVEQLVEAILNSDSLVALRVLAELLLHNDSRLSPILANTEVVTHWQRYEEDWGTDSKDRAYAEELKKKTA